MPVINGDVFLHMIVTLGCHVPYTHTFVKTFLPFDSCSLKSIFSNFTKSLHSHVSHTYALNQASLTTKSTEYFNMFILVDIWTHLDKRMFVSVCVCVRISAERE